MNNEVFSAGNGELPSQPVAKDERAGCLPWCGWPYHDKRIPNRCGKGDASGVFLADGDGGTAQPSWCSPACRDAKYPPLPAPSPARPAVEVGDVFERLTPGLSSPVGYKLVIESIVGDGLAQWREPHGRLNGLHVSSLIKLTGDYRRLSPAPAQPAETVKPVTLPIGRIELAKCDRCGKGDGSATMCGFDGRRVLWCTLCHFQAMAWSRRQSNDPVDFGVSLLHNPAIPERITAPKLAHQCFDDSTMPEAGR